MQSIGKKMVLVVVGVLVLVVGVYVYRTNQQAYVTLQVDIEQNQEAIYLSTFAEPPQFAIWVEGVESGDLHTVFVTHRSGIGDWEGKPDVPVAIPYWKSLFGKRSGLDGVTGATPKSASFTIEGKVPAGQHYYCWIEMNLAGDFNETFPQFNEKELVEDEFFCGQPALLYKAELESVVGTEVVPELVGQSVWLDGKQEIMPVSAGVTTAKHIFEQIKISIVDKP